MNKLIILAHPSEYGFARRAARAYAESSQAKGHEVKIIDLYKEPRQDFLSFNHPKEIAPDPLRDKYQTLITWSEEVSFFFPLWWIEAPAILKNFIDCNLSAGFAFRYINGRPAGLLKGRSARVFITCDGALILYRIFLTPFKTIWKTMILGLCGLKTASFVVYDQMNKKSEEDKKLLLEKIAIIAKE